MIKLEFDMQVFFIHEHFVANILYMKIKEKAHGHLLPI